MAPLALLAIVAGVLGMPGVTDTFEHFLEPSFSDSQLAHEQPGDGAEWIGLAVGGIVSVAGILGAWIWFMRRPDLRLALRERFAGVMTFLVNKWYFDELFELTIVRPMARAGQFGRTVVESRFVQGVLVDGTVGLVRMGTAFARSIQTGELRGYALLLLVGMSGLLLYFLVVSS
jgi:NADH-quinone oxidoreductase subunit L